MFMFVTGYFEHDMQYGRDSLEDRIQKTTQKWLKHIMAYEPRYLENLALLKQINFPILAPNYSFPVHLLLYASVLK